MVLTNKQKMTVLHTSQADNDVFYASATVGYTRAYMHSSLDASDSFKAT